MSKNASTLPIKITNSTMLDIEKIVIFHKEKGLDFYSKSFVADKFISDWIDDYCKINNFDIDNFKISENKTISRRLNPTAPPPPKETYSLNIASGAVIKDVLILGD